MIGGTHGSLELPNLRLWSQRTRRSWWEPIDAEAIAVDREDPLVRQMGHFVAVIRGEAAPLVPGEEGLRTLEVVEAVKRSALTGAAVHLTARAHGL